MQSAAASQQQGLQGGVPPCRSSSSSSPENSSSSSPAAASLPTSRPGFESMQQQNHHHQQQNHHNQHQQQQQQQQQNFRQQQQLLRKSQGDEGLLTYQAGNLQGIVVGSGVSGPVGPTQMSQQARNFMDLAQQQQVASQLQGEGQAKNQNQMNAHAYLQFALQAAQHKARANIQSQQQGKAAAIGSTVVDQELLNNLKHQELMRLQAANQAQMSMFKKSPGQFMQMDKHMEQGQTSNDVRNETKTQPVQVAQLPGNVVRPGHGLQNQHPMQSLSNNQYANLAQLQALQAWAMDKNIDISSPANAHLIPQLLIQWQARIAALQKANDGNLAAHQARLLPGKSDITSSSVQGYAPPSNPSTSHSNSMPEVHAVQGGLQLHQKPRQAVATGSASAVGSPAMANPNVTQLQHSMPQGGDYQVDRVNRHQNPATSTMASIHGLSSSPSVGQVGDSSVPKNAHVSPESLQMQYYRQLHQFHRPPMHPAGLNEGSTSTHLSNPPVNHPAPVQQQYGFTKHQLIVLRAQILAFRRLKRGESTLPPDVIRAIVPPPLQPQQCQTVAVPKEKIFNQNAADQPRAVDPSDAQRFVAPNKGPNMLKEERDMKESIMSEERKPTSNAFPGIVVSGKEVSPIVVSEKEEKINKTPVKMEQEAEQVTQVNTPTTSELPVDRSKTIVSKPPQDVSSQVKKHPGGNTAQVPKDMNICKKYHGPLFDFPPFGKKLNAFLPTNLNGSNGGYSLSIGYDVKDLLFEEGKDVLNKKRTENLKKIERLLAVKLDRKRIRPDLVVKLQIEERKLRLLDLQARIRDELDQEQQEIMAMPDRPYRKFVRLCERQRADLARQVQLSQKAIKEKHLKAVFQWRKRLFEAHWAIRDARTTRNRGVAKYHEKMLKEFSKRKDEDRNKRMEALKNNDVDRYRQMLLEQQSQIPGDAQERYLVLSSFLSQTEEYLQKLGGKITAAKAHQEVEEAAIAAAAAARAQGLSEEEVKAAAACAGQEVKTRNRFSEMNASRNNMSINKYYNLAHAVNEKIVRQPSMLRAGTLRDYQLVGLQWMLSLYNNKLNGILADEMGLGKTVQVMALIAYLMEYKGNYGPHLIIVPNAVMVNWKSELHNWLPTLSCIYYVGSKDQRVRLYSKEVCAMKFNVLVTTYEFIMRDRAKLSRVDWKYIIIDEAQRMKDRESQLSRDLDRFRCQRRLLLTGTPLQNDLQELWSLLNLLLPEVFDNRKAFHDWFSKPFQKDAPSQSSEDDWLETEKKVIIIHRLHQILEPFMLRRRVEDVEGSLPPKISVVLRCKMSALQGAIYDWIKATGSLRLDPQTEARRVESNPKRQIRAYVPLQNRCMELRKVCNHPLLSYPYRQDYSNDYMVRSCGKLWVLDRILIKLHRTGHRVLLFSTMTKLLDILEEYLQWRRLQYRRIDGTTSLEDRESAIGDFNKPGSECFLFLLSIRAAGRGLNLQSADTVVIYDPDPNPKNEEQAVARAHRIGQKREVKVIYMEAVVETITSYQKEDELRTGGTVDDEDELAGKDRYMGSVESLVRNNIQQYKIDMADEVINAGRFDQRTTQEERRVTLETLLHDEERYQETVHDVPSMQEVNRLIARSKEEVELFDQMDEELNWPGEMMRHHQIPKWLRVGSLEVNAAVTSMSKQAMKRGLVVPIGTKEEEDRLCAMHPIPAPEKKLGNMKTNSNKRLPRSESNSKKQLPHKHRDIAAVNNEGEDSEDSLEEKDGSSTHEEEGEIREDLEDEENSRAAGPEPNDGVQSEEETEIECDEGDNELSKAMDVAEKIVREGIEREAASSESSFQNGKLNTCQASSPTISAQKFGSLAALEAKPLAHPKTMVEELEEGEIVASGDSHMDFQHSGSWVHEREDGEEEQVLQPKIKRKRSMRNRPRPNSDKLEEKPNVEKRVLHPGNFYQQSSNQASYDYGRQLGLNKEVGAFSESVYDKSEHWGANLKRKQLVQSRVDDGLPETIAVSKQHVLPKHNRVNGFVEPNQDATEYPRERRDSKLIHSGGSPNCIGGGHMAETYQKRCKIVLDKLQAAINKSGGLITVLFSELPKRNENPGYYRCTVNPIDARTIEQRLDRCEYASVLDFATDVQMVLDNAGRYSSEVKPDARRYQAIFFQRMALAFPDVDFSFVKTRSLVSLGQSSTPSTSSPKQQLNPSRLLKSQDGLSLASDSGSGKYLAPRNSSAVSEEMREKATLKENISKMPKETRVMFADRAQDRERGKGDEVDEVTHPGDFVICKKKRKDRDKVVVKPRMVNQAADITQAVRGLPQKDILLPGHARQAQGWPQFVSTEKNGTSGLDTEDVQWAKPVKRLRTDTGKRRPSHI